MSKGDQTRDMILIRAATLFNKQGYFGSSLSDIMRETGLEKGGIYNHFSSKEKLALEAFNYSVNLVGEKINQALKDKTAAVERLLAVAGVFRDHFEAPFLQGGCPVMNTAIESDDANPILLEQARKAMDLLRGTLQRIVKKGIERGEFRPDVEAEAVATIFISTLEGALMLSKLYGDPKHLRWALDHLTFYTHSILELKVEKSIFLT